MANVSTTTAAGVAPRRLAARRLARPRRAAVLEWALLTLLYLAVAVVVTWPVAVRMNTAIYGFGNDNWGGIWIYHWLHRAAFGPASSSFSPELQAPFGLEVQGNTIQPIDRFFAVVFGGIGGGLVAYNLQIFVSFVLGGLSMYALARWLTGSRLAAALAGLIFTASPFHLAYAMQYPAQSTIELCPLFVLAILVALRSRRPRDALLAGFGFAGVWYSAYYYGWIGIWFALSLLAAAAVRGLWKARRARRVVAAVRDATSFAATRGALGIGAFLLLVVPALLGLALKVRADQQQFARTIQDLASGAVHPWQYVLPPHDNPVFGPLTRRFIQTHLGSLPNYEQAVYLGAVPVVLAALGLALRRRMSAAARWSWPLLLVGGLFCVLLSLGPYIPRDVFSLNAWLNPQGVHHVNNVPYYLFKLSSNFRFYGRGFVWTSICLASLAAIGFATVEPRLRRMGPAVPPVAAAALAALLAVEFANRPTSEPSWLDTHNKPWVKAVRALPAGASVVDYPIQGLNSPRSLFYMFWQTRHHHPTENPASAKRASRLAAAIEDPNQISAGAALHGAGLDYVVIHTHLPPPTSSLYQGVLPDDSLDDATAARNPWLERVITVEDATIYRVLPRPRPLTRPLAQYGDGFGGTEVEGRAEWHWLTSANGTLRVESPRPLHAVLSFVAEAIAKDHEVDFFMHGRRVVRRTVRGAPLMSNVRVPLALRRGDNVLRLRVTPGPIVADSVLHNGDFRPLTIRVRTPVIAPG